MLTATVLLVAAACSDKKEAEAPKADVLTGKQTFGLLGASYDFGVVKAFAQYTDVDYDASRDYDDVAEEFLNTITTGDEKAKIYQIGVSVPLSDKASVMASYGKLTNKLDATGA